MSLFRQLTVPAALLLGVAAAPLSGATVLDESFDAWPATGWSWSTQGAVNGATWSTPTVTGSELKLHAAAGSAYDSGTLVYTPGVATGADGIPGNEAGQVTVSFKYKWNADSMRMYPYIELATGPDSDDFLRFHFLAGDASGVAKDGRFSNFVNGAEASTATNYNSPTEFLQPDTYAYARFWIDVDQRLARWFVSDDGVNWTQKRETNMSGPAYDPFFENLETLHPRIVMQVRKDGGAATADRSITVDRIWAEAAVPEPTSAILIGLAGGALLGRRRRA